MKSGWRQLVVRPRRGWRTTWKLRGAVVVLLAVVLIPTRGFWLRRLGERLVRDDAPVRSDRIVIENYNQQYLVFEAASRLLRGGYSDHVLVPAAMLRDTGQASDVALGFVEVMTRAARIDDAEILAVRHAEPITLTVARQVAEALQQRGVRSVIVVSARYRSRRTYEVYRRVLAPYGITLTCVAAGSPGPAGDWWKTTHGIQWVIVESYKLLYYQLVVLPRI